MENIVYTITERNVILRQVSIALKIMVDIVFHWIIKLAIKIYCILYKRADYFIKLILNPCLKET